MTDISLVGRTGPLVHVADESFRRYVLHDTIDHDLPHAAHIVLILDDAVVDHVD